MKTGDKESDRCAETTREATPTLADPKPAIEPAAHCETRPPEAPAAKPAPKGAIAARNSFWSTFRDMWLPGLVCTLLGVALGWWLSFNDTQTQIHSLEAANEKLQQQKEQLHDQNHMLDQQAQLLSSQNKTLTIQGTQLTSQAGTLTAILKAVAARRGQLAMDDRGNVTLAGKPVVDSKGSVLATENGQLITTDDGRPILVSPAPSHQ